jgi:hypothetical protein
VLQKKMNLFQTLLDSDLGQFLVHAEHDNSKVMSLKVYPIFDGVVGKALPHDMSEFSGVVKTIEEVLQG